MATIALLGNPNVGKTTLFNALTGSNQHVGNWAGVTVDKKEGFIDKDIKIVDLPGIYAMDAFSNEEKISKDFLKSDEVDLIINIVDASNLERNLYLTSQLTQFNKPILLVVNMIDVARSKGININFDLLSKKLGVKIMPISASKKEGISTVKDFLKSKDYSLLDLSINNRHNFESMNEERTYKYISNILNSCITKPNESKITTTEKIDKIVLNKFLAYPAFLFILYIIFKFTFTWIGAPLQELLASFFDGPFSSMVSSLLSNTSPWFQSLIVDGIIAGVGGIITFLPIILTLFLGMSILEDSGYMARVAFIMDKIMRKVGLSGKAFIPLMMGFGCSVPGIMASRTLESEKDRKLTALILPFMSCNARLPIYAMFVPLFFPGHETLVVFSLYFLGIIVALSIALLFKNTLFKKSEEPFIVELPEYKLPEVKSVIFLTWEKGKGFLRKAGTIIFSISVLVWFLSNFSFSGMVEMDKSFLASIGTFLTPLFKPLGFANWQNSVALLTGLGAKEIVIGTLEVLYPTGLEASLTATLTSISALSFLTFCLLYTPCVAVIGTQKKEFGGKFAAFGAIYQFAVAWIVSFLVFNIGTLLF
ncbi:ferrous iron transport protein B [Clostridium senegalense]|uniref:Ferrous iron transport protein B n=1 Tax=Clostridium senegalense TaxID=1465809 RepID=A0A6M0H3S0_9CLOT|nr:ferrous iron transport protein B [Clostridium senegalense]NEU04898.1 ferrous iron transport protein B [Clostridium senegalense]